MQIDSVSLSDEGTWTVTGWAADVTEKQTADTVFVYAGDELLAWGPPNTDNKNVVRWFESEDLLRSGFVMEIEADRVGDDVEALLVVAEFGDVAVADPISLPAR